MFEKNFESFESIEETIKLEKTTVESFFLLFADDGIEKNEDLQEVEQGNIEPERVFESLFADDFTKTYEPNSRIEIDGNTYETDVHGKIFKINDEELVPSTEYEVDGNKYRTDDKGRIVWAKTNPKSTPEGERDMKAQELVGGLDRKANDQGGHILARILGGSKGIENMVAMWEKVNTGPYKKMENEIVNAVKEGKETEMETNIEYDGDSERPSKITVKYTIDGKETMIVFDNNEGSTDLMSDFQEVADVDAYQDVQDEINDAEADGEEVSVLSVKEEYDDDSKLVNIVICIRYDGENHYRNISPKQEG